MNRAAAHLQRPLGHLPKVGFAPHVSNGAFDKDES